MDHDAVARVLAGEGSYDHLTEEDQAAVRAAWAHEVGERRESLDLAAEFTALGESWSEADPDGRLVVRTLVDGN